jgi:hypothetical protein
VYVAKDYKEKAMQRALMQFTYPQNYDLVYSALRKAGRLDLVSMKQNALLRPKSFSNNKKQGYQNPRKKKK